MKKFPLFIFIDIYFYYLEVSWGQEFLTSLCTMKIKKFSNDRPCHME